MYFWNIRGLRAQLIGPGLTPAQELAYLIAVLGVVATTFVTVPEHNSWSAVYGGLFGVLLVLGSLHAFRCNGGPLGRQFVSRYLAVAWVCGVRWATMLVVPITVTMVGVPGSPWELAWPGSLAPLGPFDVVVRLLPIPPLFLLVGRQLRIVARHDPGARGHTAPGGVHPQDLEPLED